MGYPVLSLRPLAREDIERVRCWRNQERIRRNMLSDAQISVAGQQAWFEALTTDPGRRHLLVELDGHPVGCLYYARIRERQAELGYYLGEERIWPGTGVLLELAALDHAFDRLELDTLFAEVLEHNPGPQRLHDLFGFERVGVREAVVVRDGEPLAALRFRYRNEDWRARRAAVLAALPRPVREAAARMEI
ncbi:MAG: UDP-4-amino-4,6-dideoxy-N-acetyl-beta-L-altrosamine N-acetyltransferase [Rhodocyclaceae bacterium]|jgi:UDP-4-amino-4,6-dideoxy-N-acetyl-beta-L-altrosamine N-acetyltransferase|nr:UDP-4-amino-4,6-dideoxy-N-acetyl-beta-L-altrosamine N-acetyltransferase [Rhodocyclaceae bacterium]